MNARLPAVMLAVSALAARAIVGNESAGGARAERPGRADQHRRFAHHGGGAGGGGGSPAQGRRAASSAARGAPNLAIALALQGGSRRPIKHMNPRSRHGAAPSL